MTTALRMDRWCLYGLQTYNWGGFNGHFQLDPAPPTEVTVISGDSGTGKSTLMDAVSALLHPGRDFNRASSGSGSSPRSIPTYVRGRYGKDSDGRNTVYYDLRGGRATWSGVALTWCNIDGRTLTMFSAWYMNKHDEKPSAEVHGHIDGQFAITNLDPYTKSPHNAPVFKPAALREAFPGITIAKNRTRNRQWLFEQFGMSDREKSLTDVLYRLQSSSEIPTVNWLFSGIILDEPEDLFAAVRESRSGWEKVRETYQQMTDRETRHEILQSLPEQWDTYSSSTTTGKFYRDIGFGVERGSMDHNTPFYRWFHQRNYDLLAAEQDALDDTAQQAHRAKVAAEAVTEAAKQEMLDTDRAYRNGGGDRLREVESELTYARRDLETVRRQRERLTERIGHEITVPETVAERDEQRAASIQFITDAKSQTTVIDGELEAAQHYFFDTKRQLDEKQQTYDYYIGRKDVLSRHLTERRDEWARITGIPAEDLKFVGELIDLKTQHEQWRTAAEGVMGSFAQTLLVPQDRIKDFRRKVDADKRPPRIRSKAIPTSARDLHQAPDEQLAAKLQYANHRYTGWLSHEIAHRFAHLCVADGEALNALNPNQKGVSLNGQVRQGDDGVHGGLRPDQRSIGFSPEALLAKLRTEIAELRSEWEAASDLRNELKTAKDKLTAAADLHTQFIDAADDWRAYDMHAAAAVIAAKIAERDALSGDKVIALRNAAEAANKAHTKAQDASARAGLRYEQATVNRDAHLARQDLAYKEIEKLKERVAALDEAAAARLDAEARETFGTETLTSDHFVPASTQTLIKAFGAKLQAASKTRNDAAKSLLAVMHSYNSAFPPGPLGNALPKASAAKDFEIASAVEANYEAYEYILHQNTLEGLREAQELFAQQVMDYTNMTVGQVTEGYEAARRDIKSRLHEVNSLLDEADFDGSCRLQVEIVREEQPQEAKDFQVALGELAARTTKSLSHEDVAARYERFDSVMHMISTDDKIKTLFDVRKHMQLQARKSDPAGVMPSVTYDRLSGEQSGGETQELTSFILAAAIRYYVSGDGAHLPRFSTVILDEALTKAGPEHTLRALNVWRKLGFQPIVSTPVGKAMSMTYATSVVYEVAIDDRKRSRLWPITLKNAESKL
ncbi:hypothetical protein E3G42_003325 [Mycobacteroides abscessus]|uniref:ATP-binding protein n=1 Tax=Mycobacteroides abscessus TaxID=36809 RepID=UPI00092B1020|nr:SbcC/MukB-like Walker B domain-containing protein [Mycobacteroides abscessus]MBE5485001.1 hypothetical protein [Mycobacteroides abscessus]MDO3337537.1 ATP-binding protein [Mycobacteroides abscessus subsp. abscessus]QOF25044.1 hypothetical protein E3G42_003325 [Mycobacteroides abscessus]SHR57881.1 cytosolic protein [Mycobacteroides abscessus subsp. abscessus]